MVHVNQDDPEKKLANLKEYCKDWGFAIYVREQVEGKWATVAFDSLSDGRKEFWVNKWLRVDILIGLGEILVL